VALFGGLFVWMMIFVTHFYFRRAWVAGGNRKLPVRMWGYPYLTILGAALIAAIILSTIWVDGMQQTLEAGLPWLGALTAIYFVWKRKAKPAAD